MTSMCVDNRNHPIQFGAVQAELKTTKDAPLPGREKLIARKVCLIEGNGLPPMVREFNVLQKPDGYTYDSPKGYHIAPPAGESVLSPFTWLPYQEAGLLQITENMEKTLKDKDILKPLNPEKIDEIKGLIFLGNMIGSMEVFVAPLANAVAMANAVATKIGDSLSPTSQTHKLSETLVPRAKTRIENTALKTYAMRSYMESLRVAIHSKTLIQKMLPSLSARAADEFKTYMGQARDIAIDSLSHFFKVETSPFVEATTVLDFSLGLPLSECSPDSGYSMTSKLLDAVGPDSIGRAMGLVKE